MSWPDIMAVAAPLIGNGAGVVAFTVIWMIRDQLNQLKKAQAANDRMLQRVVRIHCERYPAEAYRLMHDEGGA